MNEVPKEKEWTEKIEKMEIFRKVDPSQYYEPLHKVGSGGFA
jgi:hypothetical protein